jgi:stage V sporulation protein B
MNKKTIVKQAGILAIAGIIVRIIGVLYRSPLTALIGDEGNGYYSTAYNIYAMILLISSYSIPTAISKLVSEKIALGKYADARKVFRCAIIYITVVAGSAALLAFILAPWIVDRGAVFALRILCPTIFLSGLVGVMRGYFQAYNTTLYTSISQIIEQMLNAIVSVGAAYFFIKAIGFGTPKSIQAQLGAGGSALGTGAGVMIALIYLFVMFVRRRSSINEKYPISAGETPSTTRAIFKSILNIVTPIIIATCVYNLVTVIDMSIFYSIMRVRGMDQVTRVSTYGVYAGKYSVLMNVPVALASAMSTASIPAISGSYAKKQMKDVRAAIENAISVSMLIIIPCAVGLAVLSYPIMGVLFPQKETLGLASTCLKIGASATIFYGISTISNGILQGMGKPRIPLVNAVVALIVHVILVVILLFAMPQKFLRNSLYMLAIGTTVYAFQMCITNQRALLKIVGFKYKWKRVFVIPVIASVIMGVVAYGSYEVLFHLTRRIFFPLILAILLAMVVYFAVILFMYKDHPQTIYNIPGVDKIARKIYKK